MRVLTKKLAVLAASVAALVGLAVLLSKRPWVDQRPVLAAEPEVKELDQVIRKWRLRYPQLEGESRAHLAAGEQKLGLDTTPGYEGAEDEFRKALVLEPGSDRALAGYVQALALGRGGRLEEASYREALGMIAAAERRSGADPRVLVAHANLLLSRPDAHASDARALAELATHSAEPEVQALALVAIGQSHLATNELWAAEAFEKALKIDPRLRRGYLFRAKALRAAGHYRDAVETFERRLALSPDQSEGARDLGALYIEIGELERARSSFRRAIEAAPAAVPPRLALAMLSYQHEGRPDEAIAALGELAGLDKHSEPEVVEALGHLAAARRLKGELDAAAESAKAALAIADDPNAHLQLLLGALERKRPAEAKAHLPGVVGRLGDAGLEQLLSGRALLLGGDSAGALEAFVKAVELDPRRTDALLLAGAAAARGRSEKAYEYVLQRALRGDPTRPAPRRVLDRFYLRPSDALAGAAGAFWKLSKGRDDPNPPLCEALVQWHLGNLPAADRLFQKVLKIDPVNGAALAFRALAAQRRNELRAALALARKAVAAERELALTHYALGKTLLASGKIEEAKRAFREAQIREPGLLAVKAELGAIELSNDPNEGRKLLLAVLGRDPTYLEAMRALYRAGQ